MAKIIAVANHKGGVGKTTSCVNVGAALAKAGRSVLLVDVDPQANLTSSLTDENVVTASVYNAMKQVAEKKPAELPIIPISENLDIVPSNINLTGIDMELGGIIAREQILRRLLSPIRGKYDYIFIDCPPSLGLITINALTAADSVIITMCAETLPLRGLAMLDNMIEDIAESLNPALHVSGIIIAKYNRRKLDNAVIETIRTKYGDRVYNTFIRNNVALAEAPTFRQSVLDYAPGSNGAKDYTQLANEIDK